MHATDTMSTYTNRVITGPHPVALTRIRNDLLVGQPKECHHGDGRTFCRHFWADVARADLAILNCGRTIVQDWTMKNIQGTRHNVPSTTLLVWRTTVPGHEVVKAHRPHNVSC